MQNAKLYALGRSRPLASGLFLAAALFVAGAFGTALAADGSLVAVDSVQWPVWVERDGSRRPLKAGEPLQVNDRLATGTGGRVLLRLADGSGVKLGENAQFAIEGLGKSQDRKVLNAALDVARGAFRFTTGLFQPFLKQRSVSVRVATITAGIRGTDIWGRSDGERDLVCLLEGRISVSHPKVAEPQVMDQALTFYTAAKGKAPGAVVPVDPAQVALWSAETEIEPGRGVGTASGRWQVRLAWVGSATEALALVDEVGALGYPVVVRPQREGDAISYALRIRHLASEAEASAVAARLGVALKRSDITVSR